jgi:hypothetical protein
MATIGWIKIGVTTDTSKFKHGMDSAAEQINKFRESIIHAAEAFAVWEAAKGAIERVKGAIEGIGQTKILAERVGMTAEAFGKLSYAAKLAHVDQDQLAVSLEQMNKRLGEVAMTGEGPTAKALQRVGLSAQQLTKMGTAEAFNTLVGVLEKIENPMQRAAVAAEMFGKSGQGIINLAGMGSERLKELGIDAERLGIALNSVDAEKVMAAEHAMMELSAATDGLYNLIAVKVAPIITELIEKYLEWGYSGTKSADFVAQGMDWVVKGLGLAVDGVNFLKAAFYGVQAVITTMFEGFATGIDSMLKGIAELVERFTGFKMEVTDFFKDWAAGLDKAAAAQIDVAAKAWNQIGKGGQQVRKLVNEIDEAAFKRAQLAAGKAGAFVAPGAMKIAPEKPAFAAAAELGSKEAYSTVVRSIAMSKGETVNKQIARNTKDTAEGIKAMADILKRGGNLKPALPGAA